MTFLLDGLLDLPWWAYIVYTLCVTHITIVSVTLYLHRHQAHRSLDMHPLCSHFFRFWLWLTTGMRTQEWVAIHRKHHACVETREDPHSPLFYGIARVLFSGAELYRDELVHPETMADYGHGTPEDWIESHLYGPGSSIGIALMLLLNIVLFGPIGLSIWAVQMAWIPFLAAGVINGLGHWRGYRNFASDDTSTNIVPWGILIGGEELHNNHHAFASSAKFSIKPWEFDIGWLYLRLLSWLGLVKVKKVAPRPICLPHKCEIDENTVGAVILNRLHVLSEYGQQVVKKVFLQESAYWNKADQGYLMAHLKPWLHTTERLLDDERWEQLERLFNEHEKLRVVYDFRERLQEIWTKKTATKANLTEALQEWCNQAEQTGIGALEQFSRRLRSYSLNPATA